jgi:class 3 adenylate cyclase/predicted ATPase
VAALYPIPPRAVLSGLVLTSDPRVERGEPAVRSGRATVLFADVLGYNALADAVGEDDAYTIVTRLVRLLEGAARRHGGAIDKYLGDALMAVYGLPAPLADAPLAAVRAAVDMRALALEYCRDLRLDPPLALQIGINTGPILSGDVRGEAVSEFRIMGDAVNVAARLKGRAPVGGTYVGVDTWSATRDRFRYRPLGELALAGRGRRAQAFALEGVQRSEVGKSDATVMHFTPFVGRGDLLATLLERSARAREGSGCAVVIHGPEGSGKSRLLAEFRGRLEAGLESVEVGRDPESPERSAYAALVGSARPAPPAAAAEAVLARARREPLALVVDEFDRLLPDDRETTRRLAERASSAPVLIVITSREDPASPSSERLHPILAVPGVLRLDLPPLMESEQDALIEHLAADAPRAREARQLIRARAQGNPLRILHSAFVASALLADQQRETSSRALVAERRRATVLFADLTGFTSMIEGNPTEESFFLVQGCLETLDEVVRRHGGVVHKHLGDCVFATFGVPIALENSTEAALNAAIAMRRRVAEYSRERGLAVPLEVHFGIETGRAIAGDVSGPVIREHALMGQAVNVASRLEELAPPGAIFVGEQAWRRTRDRFEFRSLSPIRLPGRRTDVATYELLSEEERPYRARATERTGLSSELVGRDGELDRLRSTLTALAHGRGRVVSVIGEAGIGKSRLVEELRGVPEATEVLWLEGRCLAVGADLSFHPFADLLRGWSGLGPVRERDDSAPVRLRAAVEQALPERTDEVLPFLASVLQVPLDAASRERLRAIDGDVLPRLVTGSVRELLRALASGSPLVLSFEDLHWADGSSIDLLESLLPLAADHPILFLHTFRPGFEASERIHERAARELDRDHLEMILRPLEPSAARRLIRNLFRGGEVPHAVRATIEERAAGNPFFAEEVARNLLEEGALELRHGSLTATDRIHTAVIPGSIEEVIMARIDHLDPAQKEILDAAAVIGGTIPIRLLDEVAGKDGLVDALSRMEQAGLLVPSPTGAPAEVAFKHPLLQEVAYDRLLRVTRQTLHGRVGRALEELSGGASPGRHALLAYHYGRAGEAERAEEHLFRAGDEAARAAASNEALRYFREAARLYLQIHGDRADPAKLATLEGSVALALYNRGRLIEAVEHFDRALELLGRRVARSALARNTGLAWNLVRALGQSLRANPGWSRPPASPRDQQIIELMFRRGLAQTTTEPTRFVADTLTVLHTLSRLDPSTVTNAGGIYAHAAVGIFSWGGLSFTLAARFLDRSRRVIDRAPERNVLINYRVMRFVHHFLVGDWSGAHDIDEDLLERSLGDGRLWEVTTYLGLDAERLIARGEFAEARERIARIDEIWEAYQYDVAKSNHYALPTYLALEERRLAEATRLAEAYYDEIPDDPLHLLALSAEADALRLQGDLAGAERTLDRGRPILERAGATTPPFHRSRFLLSELAVQLASFEQGGEGMTRRMPSGTRRRARAALALAARVALRRPAALRLRGRLAWLEGRRRGALRFWEHALAVSQRLGARPEEARIRAEMAVRMARVSMHEAEEHDRAARQSFTELGLAWDLERLEEAVAR